MKTTKRLFALLVSLALVLAMSVTSFAATGSITINNTSSTDKTYNIYKLFDATTDGNGSVAYTYTTNTNTTDNFLAALQDTGSPFTLVQSSTGTGTVTYNVTTTADAATIVAWLSANASVLPTAAASLTIAAGGSDTANNLDYGYYYVTGTPGAVVELNSLVESSITINDKDTVTFNKTEGLDASSVTSTTLTTDVGDTVYFQIEGKVPDYSSYTSYTYKITDTLSSGLELDTSSIVVQTYNTTDGYTTLTAGVNYTLVTTGFTNGEDFEITIYVMGNTNTGGAALNIGDTIYVTYSAKLTGTSGEQTNTAELEYSNNPTDSSDTETVEKVTYVYNAEVIVDKVITGTSTKLAGATFVLYNNDGKYYKLENGVVTWVDNISDATSYTSDGTNTFSFVGLASGTYYLLETEAPAGYNKLTDAISFTVDATNSTTPISLTANSASASGSTITVSNTAGSLMPTTGGMGTTIFYILGAVLVIGAGVLLVVRRRMNSEK